MLIQTTSSLVRIEGLNVTTAKLVDEPFRRCAEARIPPSKNRLKSYTSKDWGSEPLAEFSGCITKLSCWLLQAAQALPANTLQTEACSFIEVDELCSFVAKKIQRLDLDSDEFYVWQSAWVCGSRSIKTVREIFKLRGLPRAKARHSQLRSNHSIVVSGITWPDCTVERCAIVNSKRY